LGNSHFTNPTGLDQVGNYSSASDLVKLAYLVTKDSVIKEITSTALASITSSDGVVINLKNTNKLLGTNNITGIKTGSTELAGENLIASTNVSGHTVITAVLGSSDRFNDTLVLIREIGRVYRWQVESNLNLGPILGISNTGE
jgi:D-alanyl-D-alanine carboxypeptidase (penicillin-binding protein 5/6)